eukprot:gene752-19387_t
MRARSPTTPAGGSATALRARAFGPPALRGSGQTRF